MSGSETKQGDILCIGEIFESIAGKDEQTLARTLERSSIKTMLLFESVYGISPLLHCARTGDMSHLGLVRCLLKSGLCDSETVDSKGRTVLAGLVGAHAQTERTAAVGYLERMIEIVIEGADDSTACYRMLKHNSLPLFKAFLSLKQYDEGRLFECLTCALTKLRVKLFILAVDLELFVLGILADYEFRHFSGNWTGGRGKTVDEWKAQAGVVIDCWSVIGKRYDNASCNDIDNRLLHRLLVIHNHLYFLHYLNQNHQRKFLEHLRLRELVKVKRFLEQTEQKLREIIGECQSTIVHKKESLIEELMEKMKISCKVTIYQQYEAKRIAIGSCNQNPDTLIIEMIKRIRKEDYEWANSKSHELKALQQRQKQWLIEQFEGRLKCIKQPQNVADRILAELKRNPVGRIAATIVASESFDLEHLMRGKDRRTRRKLIKCYGQLRQLYSLHKIYIVFSHVSRVQPANVETFQDCLKRTVMTLGEMLKNTKSTPNMPNGRLKQAMGCMITRRFADIVISLRNSYARPFSLSQLLIDANLERRVYSSLPQQTVVIRMVMNLLFVVQMAEVRRSFYGMLMRCGSLDALRSLLIYTSKQDVFSTPIQTVFGQVTQYFAKAKGLLAELSENPVGNTVEFSQLEDQFQVQCGIVDEVKAMLAAEKVLDYESLHQKCISCNDLPTIRRLLHSKINAYRPNAVLESIGNRWNGNGSSILRVPGMVVRLSGIDTELVCNELARIVDATREAKTSYKNHTSQLIEDLNISEEVDDVEGVEQLTELLAPYYENIFLLDKKWSVLRSFCKQRRLPWNETDAQRLRQRDEQQLQAMYDERHRKLQTILARPDFRQVDPVRRNIIVQEDMNATLEQLQLELCAILTAVGYFGTSFQRIKQGIPLIQGRNYRNLLAHDSLSYNMLSDSGDVKKTVNALVFNRLQIRLFESKQNESIELRLPSLENMYQWVEEQQQLLACVLADDLTQTHAMMRSGGEIKGYFCFTPDVAQYSAAYYSIGHKIKAYCALAPSLALLFDRYFPFSANTE
ncbi:uncharacterized protein LOC121594462 [Anopheles merus]|uniref:uncharacterized protein LOC121594462 n=1 Tax=Anopheles merus TaxID=30066 RepID=UPI001BE3F026|nr:uncharacterized protein LOC121594462 [Anopheles merus]